LVPRHDFDAAETDIGTPRPVDEVPVDSVTLPNMSDASLLDRRGVLESLLEEELHFDATTSNGLTSHLPMALVAKSGLGASNEELRRFANVYRRRLSTRSAASTELTGPRGKTPLVLRAPTRISASTS
jgi:hypothetical protein